MAAQRGLNKGRGLETLFPQKISREDHKTALEKRTRGDRPPKIREVPAAVNKVLLRSVSWNPDDRYENADMLDYRANKIFYTEDSEYLNWFFTVNEKQNAQIFEEARIYHFQILTEDTILDVLSDAFPVIHPVAQTDAC